MSRRGGGVGSWGTGALTALLVLAAFATPVSAAPSPFDNVPGESLNADAWYESAAVFEESTPVLETAEFTLQPQELEFSSIYLECGNVFGARDAWVRFATKVEGDLSIFVSKTTPGNLYYNLWSVPWQTGSPKPGLPELAGHQLDCQNSSHGSEESGGKAIAANTVVLVQAVDECPAPATEPCEDSEVTSGGPTTVRLRFTPKDPDGDGFAEPLDNCPSAAGPKGGCPLPPPNEDVDKDGYKATAFGGTDCNDNAPGIHPGALDIPGDHVDQNCDGLDRADPVVSNEVTFKAERHPTYTVIKSPVEVAGPLAKGMEVILRCVGGGCTLPRQKVMVRRRTAGGVKLGGGLVGESLLPGASLIVKISRPGYIGRQVSYTIRRHAPVKKVELCLPPDEGAHPRGCG
jgi:hypothetical protein